MSITQDVPLKYAQKASRPTKEKIKSKSNRTPRFEPTDDQIEAVCQQIMGVMRWHCGVLDVGSKTHAQLAREIYPKLHRRVAGLGRTEMIRVIEAAVGRLEAENQLDFRPEDGICMSRDSVQQRRRHHDKYAHS